MSCRTCLPTFFKCVLTTEPSLLIAAFVFIVSMAVGALAWLTPPTKAEPLILPIRAEHLTTNVPQANSSQERIGAEIIRLRPDGFEPSEITRPKGRFILHVENRTVLADVSLSLSREAGGRESEARLLKKRKWAEVIDLQPGRYVLTEASNPKWSCRITITPQ